MEMWCSEGAGLSKADEKLHVMMQSIRQMGKVLVAFSGGVDSSFVLVAALKAIGPSQVLAVTAASDSVAKSELEEASQLARAWGAAHRVIQTQELSKPGYVQNDADRCYHCKTELFDRLSPLAQAEGYAWILDGTNADDAQDHRPGRRAAREHGIRSPLLEAGLTKAEIRERSRAWGLSTHDKPASPCLSSRIAYFEPVTAEKLRAIEQAEAFLKSKGFGEVRVRWHNGIARIELPKLEISRLLEEPLGEEISEALKSFGFLFVTVDLEGLRSGSLNTLLKLKPA